MRDKAFIDGRWVEGREKKTFNVINPANGAIIGAAPDLNEQDASIAISAASEAFSTWKDTTGKERGAILRKWFSLLTEHADELANIVSAESGRLGLLYIEIRLCFLAIIR